MYKEYRKVFFSIYKKKKGGELMADITEISKGTQFKSGANAVENGRKGGKANGKTLRRRKAFKEVFNTLLAETADLSALDEKEHKGEFDKMISAVAEQHEGITYNELIAMAQIMKAISGDNMAFLNIRDTMGERPADKQEVSLKEIPKISVVRKDG
jgi:hypothetical protein